jgi:3-dehydroquinate synthase
MQRVDVSLTGSAYAVLTGPNLLERVGPEAKRPAKSRNVSLLTDNAVAGLYLEPVEASLRGEGLEPLVLIVPPGEESKNLAQAGDLYDRMLRAGMDRGSVLVALGGGVVTDLGGFVAATYMRGIAWIAVSTTLLGQVDASVGGKTAVDHPLCKNLIGAFHQPAAVLADVGTLATLPDEELRNGLAEVVKHGVIRDADLFETVETDAASILARDPEVLEQIVAQNVRIKADVVAADEREGGLRRILNYGHTIGHALESLLGLTHGRAVALGMVAEADLAVRRGLLAASAAGRQRGLLERLGLPVRLEEAPDLERCLEIMRHDKKAEAGRHRFVLPSSIGEVDVHEDVTDEEILAALGSLAGG